MQEINIYWNNDATKAKDVLYCYFIVSLLYLIQLLAKELLIKKSIIVQYTLEIDNYFLNKG